VREAILKFDNLRSVIIEKLLEQFPSIKNAKVHRHALWILGEHCASAAEIGSVVEQVKEGLGKLPIVDDEISRASASQDDKEGEEEASKGSSVSRTMVTVDGTYATQSAFTASAGASVDAEARPILRTYLMKGDFFIGTAIGSTLAKLALKFLDANQDDKQVNILFAESMLMLASIIHYGKSGMPEKPITEDDLDRLSIHVRVLAERNPVTRNIFVAECRKAVTSMLEGSKQLEEYGKGDEKKVVAVQADDSISFMQLFTKADQSAAENQFEVSLLQAIGTSSISKNDEKDALSSKLNKVTQLTGFSDPIYAEAYVNVNQYDIVLDVLIVNQTTDTLQNVTLELATLGDLKLVEKPSPVMLAAHDFSNIKASVKVASTENGIIFGNIVYDVSGGSGDRNCVVLNDIHIDIMDYIVGANFTDQEFRAMWAEFEWENKVAVNTNITETRAYLDHIIKYTGMKCLTPEKAISGECGFLAANLYAKSIFGEDALANLSIEKPHDGDADTPVVGHIRIRAKSQGMALSLGDKINLSQKKVPGK